MEKIAVVGSANLDLVVSVNHLPSPGETILGSSFDKIPGGKGANQAVAASKLGGQVSFIGCIGSDQEGKIIRENLENANVDCEFLFSSSKMPTGIAMIGVDKDGNNSIIVNPGANSDLSHEKIDKASAALESAKVVLLQLEIPVSSVEAAIDRAKGITILNPAPSTNLSSGLLEKVDVLIPNQVELAHLSNKKTLYDIDEVEDAASGLGVETVITTLGSKGALIVSNGVSELVPSPAVESVDTTGAGDSFCGSVAALLSRGLDLSETVKRSVVAAALSTTKHGAQNSMPEISEVDSFLKQI